MFLPFVHGGTDTTGLGLGLALSRKSVALFGGTLSAKDVPGTGCVFTVELPPASPCRKRCRQWRLKLKRGGAVRFVGQFRPMTRVSGRTEGLACIELPFYQLPWKASGIRERVPSRQGHSCPIIGMGEGSIVLW